MASFTGMELFFLINFVLAGIVTAKLYDKKSNTEHNDVTLERLAEKRFRMNKINLLWDKAQKRVAPGELVELYGDLVVQDKLELETKKAMLDGQDDNGERQALVRMKFLEIIKKYDLYMENDARNPNKVDENDTMQKELPTLEGEKKMEPRLAKIWKKALESGFSTAELEQLRSEFLHHQQKLDEFEQLKNEVDNYAENSIDNNLTEMKEGYNPEEHKEKKLGLKEKWRQIKDGYSNLETLNAGKIQNRTFTEPKVASLWSLAKNANFSEIELESFKEELKHFEHRLQKQDFFQKELAIHSEKVKSDPSVPSEPNHLEKLEQKVSDGAKKIKKLHHELNSRIKSRVEL